MGFKKSITVFFAPIQYCLLLTGCATSINGTKEDISVSSNPPGATVSDGTTSKETPAVFSLNRNKEYLLTISKGGYETKTVQIKQVISGALVGDLLTGSLIGTVIDFSDGAMWRLEPETITINLRPLRQREKHLRTSKTVSEAYSDMLQELNAFKQQNLLTEAEYQAIRTSIRELFETGSPSS